MKISKAFKKAFGNGICDVKNGTLINSSRTIMFSMNNEQLMVIVNDKTMKVVKKETKLPSSLTGPTGIVSCVNLKLLKDGIDGLLAMGASNVALVLEPKNDFPVRLVDLDGNCLCIIAPRIIGSYDEKSLEVIRKHAKEYKPDN